MPLKPTNRRYLRGVTLVELLVGLAVGALVSMTVIAAWGLTVQTASYSLGSARLNHDLRSTMQLLSQDLRRADGGVDLPSERAIRFSAGGDCVTYFVDGVARGFRRNEASNGAFQMYFNDSPTAVPTCTEGGSSWVALEQGIAPGQFEITDFIATWRVVCYPFLETEEIEEFDSVTHGAASFPRCDDMDETIEVLEIRLELTGQIGTGSGTKALTLSDVVTVRNNLIL
jgi:hypothetical protein